MSLIQATHDSLPYIDTHTPEELDSARALITAALPPSSVLQNPHPSLPPLPEMKFTPAMQSELDRIAASEPLDAISTTHYESPSSLEQVIVANEYVRGRQQSLELLEKFGKNAWLIHNSQLEDILRGIEKEYVETKEAVEGVNRERKRAQKDAEAEIRMLEREWKEGVGRCLEVEIGMGELEERIRVAREAR